MPSVDHIKSIKEIPKFQTSNRKFMHVLQVHPSQPDTNVDDEVLSEDSCDSMQERQKLFGDGAADDLKGLSPVRHVSALQVDFDSGCIQEADARFEEDLEECRVDIRFNK